MSCCPKSLSAAAISLVATSVCAQAQNEWSDPSPHRVEMVPVKDGAKVEVLDWGGRGRPLVLLAGYLTAHAYDELAPKLTGFAHVYGITRRGLGASSRTDGGYTAKESAADVVAALDRLRLAGPILAGHSFGGQDLSTVAAEYPERIGGLVYLNSAEDPKLEPSDFDSAPPDPRRLPAAMRNPPPPDKSSLAAYRDWQAKTQGVAFPESELRWLYAVNSDGSLGEYRVSKHIRDALFAGLRRPEYQRIRVPVLAFFVIPPNAKALTERYPMASSDERAAIEQKCSFDRAVVMRHIQDLKRSLPSARIVELPPGGNFYVFLSNKTELIKEIRSFAAGLP